MHTVVLNSIHDATKRCLIILSLLMICLFVPVTYAAETLFPLEGQPVSLEQMKGKWLLINFWASWCGPCVEEIQTLNAFYKAHHHQVHLFAVNMDEVSPEKQLSLAKQFRLDYPSLDAEKTHALLRQNISAVPATFVYAPGGQLHRVLYGQLSSRHLMHLIQPGMSSPSPTL